MHFLRLIYRIALDAFYGFLTDDGWAIASHIALSMLMSLFPFLIFIAALSSYLGGQELADAAASFLLDYWPAEVAGPIASEVASVLTTPRSGVLTVSVVLAIYFSSRSLSEYSRSSSRTRIRFREICHWESIFPVRTSKGPLMRIPFSDYRQFLITRTGS